LISQDVERLFFYRGRTQFEVHKPDASDSRRFANIVSIEMRDDSLCQRARIFAALLPKHQSSVGLVIAKALIRGLRQFAGFGQAGARQSVGKLFRE
jgi:hypothetical protein